MAIFRIEKTNDYTVMSNHHLRNRGLTLKAKGLLSQMLSLPPSWDYTLAGLAKINRESVDAIRTAVKELERFGYIVRRQCRDESGRMTGNEYIIYEQPRFTLDNPPETDIPQDNGTAVASPLLDFPTTDNPTTEKPLSDYPTQLNTNLLSTESIEKKNTKRKGGGRKRVDLDDENLKQKTIDWIAAISPPDTSSDVKNDLYRAVLRFYAPRESKKVTPAKTQAGFDALVSDLERGSNGSIPVMVSMLNKATISKWKSVYPQKQVQQSNSDERPLRANEVRL